MKFVFLLILSSTFSFAHTALLNCFDNGDNTITCEGGFSDGSRVSGVNFLILQKGQTILESKFDSDSEVTFKKPYGDFSVLLDGGEGHKVSIDGKNIR